jgi:hypothetical protein
MRTTRMPNKGPDLEPILSRRMITSGELILALQRVPAQSPIYVCHPDAQPRGLERVMAVDARSLGMNAEQNSLVIVFV